MTIKLLTLNIEASRHLDRVHSALSEHAPHIACLQEVVEEDCAYLASSYGYEVRYAPSGFLPASANTNANRRWGVAVLTRVPIRNQETISYADDPTLRTLHHPNDARRVLVMTQIEHGSALYRIGTTHFTWTPNGQINADQVADFARLTNVLSDRPDYVLCGDFNSPRGRDMFGKFIDELHLIDHLPQSVTTTIDGRFHVAGALNLVVDTIFSTPHYRASHVQVLEGVSDHKGILALIERVF